MKTYLNHAERQLASFFAICYGLIDSATILKDNVSLDMMKGRG